MSHLPAEEPACPDTDVDPFLAMVIHGKPRDLGGFEVRRLLPTIRCRAVGPFVFFDQMGPAHFASGQGLDVRPHPHIGLATVTYLFEGELMHRDSLGTVQPIRPGDVNWMTAGRGIAHSERTGAGTRAAGGPLYGIQAWVALPRADEESAPAFVHYPAGALPTVVDAGVRLRLIAGEFAGRRSPVVTASATLYADVALDAASHFALPSAAVERALYVVEGSIDIGGRKHTEGALLVLRKDVAVGVMTGPEPVRMMLLGGAPLDAPRHMWWNFVSSSQARIEQAKTDWREGRFAPVPDETEFIPLPEG